MKLPWVELSLDKIAVGRVVLDEIAVGRVVLGRIAMGRVVLSELKNFQREDDQYL